MTTSHSRRNLLRGRLTRPEPARLRPPGAQPGFAGLCTQCGDCARACPERIIIRHESGEPVVDFARGACTFCGDCAAACPTGALLAADVPAWPWRAVIGDGCLSLSGVACRACEDACAPRAIRFRPQPGGRAAPLLDAAACTGCGECAGICPVEAISFQIPAPVAVPQPVGAGVGVAR